MKVSVIVPMYNASSYIVKCLNSIQNQTYNNLEVILINDGSTDNTYDIVQNWIKKDDRFILVNQNNKGVSFTRNVGVRNATGDYILYVDSDDWIEKDMIESLVSLVEDNIDIVMCSYDNEENQSDFQIEKKNVEVWDKEKQITEFLLHKRFQGMLWNKLINRKLFDEVEFDNNVGYGEDAQIMWEILKKEFKMKVTDMVLYHHVIQDNSISNKKFSNIKFSALDVWKKIEKDTKCIKVHNLLAKERLTFFVAYTLYEMYKSSYVDDEQEEKMLCFLKQVSKALIKSKNFSMKTKVFVILALLNKNVTRKVLS